MPLIVMHRTKPSNLIGFIVVIMMSLYPTFSTTYLARFLFALARSDLIIDQTVGSTFLWEPFSVLAQSL